MNNYREFLDAPPNQVPVRGFLHSPTGPGGDSLVLTHGAGANCDSPFLVALAGALYASGFTVLRCDLLFRQSRPHGPPPRGSAERDQQGLRAAIASMRRQTSGRVFLGGHSYGGRQASMLAAAEPVSSICSCYSPTRFTRRSDPASYGRCTSRAFTLLRCSFTARAMGSALSTR
jgi:uncharacterized protein